MISWLRPRMFCVVGTGVLCARLVSAQAGVNTAPPAPGMDSAHRIVDTARYKAYEEQLARERRTREYAVRYARQRRAYNIGMSAITAGLVLHQRTRTGTTGRMLGNIVMILGAVIGWSGFPFPGG